MNRQQLIDQIAKKKTFLCVGLDPDLDKIPQCVLEKSNGSVHDALVEFNRAIIDATAPYCVAYKPNSAFFEAYGVDGMLALAHTVEYIKTNYPDHFVIDDAKRGDIGNTSARYAKACFENLGADAVTVAPYMGADSVKPFLGFDGKWVVLLALTSNPGSADFQLIESADGTPLYQRVMATARTWASNDQLMFVVGATRGRMFEDVRRVAPDNFLLVPGVGAQGGSLADVCRYGMTADCGLLVNSSRGIIFKSSGEDFAQAAGLAAAELAGEMALMLKEYSRL
ncbi:MAG: orotidine-5'-phosphate decarboxylase [Muribaculaceae bacterium]|nr:orotidine-5'-phosphate decarboxylase [Muribaculaceae bacterium]